MENQKPPLTEENEKDICCCCCRSGPLCLQASIDRSGYCPGEEIFFRIKIENHSNKSMCGVEVLLLQQLTLKIEGIQSYVALKMNFYITIA